MKNAIALLFLTCFSLSLTQAQDSHFSQFFANPLHVNPALAGSDQAGRVAVSCRNQWARSGADYSTISASYDQFSELLSGGWGVRIEQDHQMGSTFVSTSAGLSYAYRLQLQRKIAIQVAMQGGVLQQRLDWERLTFEDQIDPVAGVVRSSTEQFGVVSGTAMELGAGSVVFGEQWWGGMSVNHLNRPAQGISAGSDARLARKMSIHGGMEVEKQWMAGWSFSPNVLFQAQGVQSKLNLGLYAAHSSVTIGTWWRSSNVLTFLFGIQGERLRVGYSYDLDTGSRSGLGNAHEVSLVYEVKPPKYKKRLPSRRHIKCPKF